MTSLAYCTASFSVSITLSVALKKMKIIVLLLRRFISCMRQISFPKGNKHFSYLILIMFSHSSIRISFNPFHANGLFPYPLKKSENQRFSDVFRGYRKRPMAWNGLRLPRGLCNVFWNVAKLCKWFGAQIFFQINTLHEFDLIRP